MVLNLHGEVPSDDEKVSRFDAVLGKEGLSGACLGCARGRSAILLSLPGRPLGTCGGQLQASCGYPIQLVPLCPASCH